MSDSILPFKPLPVVLDDGTHSQYGPLTAQSLSSVSDGTPFPVDCLPSTVREFVKALAEQERAPIELAACCALGAISAALGSELQIHSGPNRWSRGNLFILVGAESGTSKTRVFSQTLAPFLDREAHELESWDNHVLPMLKADKRLAETTLRSLEAQVKKGGRTDAIRQEMIRAEAAIREAEKRISSRPQLQVADVTTQRLAAMLQNETESLASLSADAREIVDNMLGRYHENGGEDADIYIKAWSGDTVRVDRIGREPVTLRSPCLAALWLIQPDKLVRLFENKAMAESGLLPRVLVCQTHAELRKISESTNTPMPEPVREAWRGLLDALLSAFRLYQPPCTFGPNASQRPTCTITPEEGATAIINGYYDEVIELRRSGHLGDVGAFAARWAEQAWRLSVILHTATLALNHDGNINRICAGQSLRDAVNQQPLARETAANAVCLVRWFAEQQLGLLEGERRLRQDTQLRKLDELFARRPEGVAPRDLISVRIAPDAPSAKALLAKLVAEGQIEEVHPPDGRRGSATAIYRRGRSPMVPNAA